MSPFYFFQYDTFSVTQSMARLLFFLPCFLEPLEISTLLQQQPEKPARSAPCPRAADPPSTVGIFSLQGPHQGQWSWGPLCRVCYTGKARCSLLSLWGQLESLYKECLFRNHTACSMLPCSVSSCIFLCWYGSLFNMCIYSHYFNSHKPYLQPDLYFISWILITVAFKKHIHNDFQSLFKCFNLHKHCSLLN